MKKNPLIKQILCNYINVNEIQNTVYTKQYLILRNKYTSPEQSPKCIKKKE